MFSSEDRARFQHFYSRAPSTFKAFQQLQMAFDDGAKHIGRGHKTLFGKDKGVVAFEKIKMSLRCAIVAMRSDGLIGKHSTTEQVFESLRRELQVFCQMTPAWDQASMFIALFFDGVDSPARGMIEEQLKISLDF